jgi:hypothetical protein
MGRKSFLLHLMDLLGDVGQMEAHFGAIIGLIIVLGTPIRTPR